MQELHVVELATPHSGDDEASQDAYLLVADDSGTTSRVRIDERLFAAVEAARQLDTAAGSESAGSEPSEAAESETSATASETAESGTGTTASGGQTGEAVQDSSATPTTEAEMADGRQDERSPAMPADATPAGTSSTSFGSPNSAPFGANVSGRRAELPLRPRDIQTRIRAGESAEDIAAAAGVPLTDIQRFEGPVLAERAWMAQRARSVVPRRGEGATTSMGELATERLGARGVSELDQDWDSWRREDSTWTVRLTWPEGNRVRLACWRYDPVRQTVVAIDDSARELTDPPAPRRLASVQDRVEGEANLPGRRGRDHVYDLEADGGLHVIGGEVRHLHRVDENEPREASAWPRRAAEAHRAEPQRGGASSRRAEGQPAAEPQLWDDGSADSDVRGEEAGAAKVAPAKRAALPAATPTTQPGSSVRDQEPTDDNEERPESTQPETTQPAAAAEAGRRKRRASVPSWDDILLGSRRSQ